jgi:hypothetical protein
LKRRIARYTINRTTKPHNSNEKMPPGKNPPHHPPEKGEKLQLHIITTP